MLLVASANIANLLLARSVRQRKEVSIQVALGITTGRLVRVALFQSLLLSAFGGALALGVIPLAGVGVRTALLPGVEWTRSTLDLRALAVVALLTLMIGLLTGGAVVVLALRRDLAGPLRTAGARENQRSLRVRAGLAVTQAAFSVVLLIVAGLFLRSLMRARSIPIGIEPDHVVKVRARWPPQGQVPTGARGVSASNPAPREQRPRRFYSSALEIVRRIPGIQSAAIAIGAPFSGSFEVGLRLPGRTALPNLPGGGPYIHAISSGYLKTVGLRLLRGRDFTDQDRAGSEHVALVSETMATQLWPHSEPLGACLLVGDAKQEPCSRVVGVVADAHSFGLFRDKPAMHYYVPLGQEVGIDGLVLLVRPKLAPATWVERIRGELRNIDPSVLWLQIDGLDSALTPELRPWRLGAVLIGGFGGLALVIAALGLYSLIAHSVVSRTYELGVRMALGARRSGIFALVLRQGFILVAIGVFIGVALSLIGGPLLGPLLFETSPNDSAVYLAVVLTLLASAGAACMAPAWRAATTAPAISLRSD